jgi:hypothetical protein
MELPRITVQLIEVDIFPGIFIEECLESVDKLIPYFSVSHVEGGDAMLLGVIMSFQHTRSLLRNTLFPNSYSLHRR